MSEAYIYIYFFVIIILVCALPVYLLFFRRKSTSRQPISEQSISLPVKCPECGYEEYLTPDGRCHKCGAGVATLLSKKRAEEAAAERAEKPPTSALSSWKALSGRALGLYRRRPFTLVTLGVASSVFTTPVFGLLWFLTIPRTAGQSYSEIFSDIIRDPLILGMSVAGAASILMLMFWSQLAFLYAHTDERLGIGGSILKGFQRLCPYMGTCLLYWAFVAAGGLFLIIPGVLFALWHTLAFAVFVREDEKPMNALRKSRAYMKGRLGEVFSKIFALIFFAILALYSSLLFAIPGILREAPLTILVPLMSFPLILFSHFSFTYLFMLYEELKAASPPEAVKTVSVEERFLPEEVPSAGELSRRAWAVYKRRAPTLAAIQCIIYALFALGFLAFTKLLALSLDKIPESFSWMLVLSPTFLVIIAIVIVIVFLIVAAIIYLVALFGSLALVFAVSDENTGIIDAFRKARQRLAAYALMSLWRDFLIAAGSIIYLPGLLFRAWYAFSPFVFALEDERGMNALAKSRAYAETSPMIFWKVLGVELLKDIFRVLPGELRKLVASLASLFIFAPLFVLSALVLAFFVAIFALLGIPFEAYLDLFSIVFANLLIYLPVFLTLFFLPAFLMLYYFQIYRAAKALHGHGL